MGVADQFFLEPMKLQSERVLSEKIDLEVRIKDTLGLKVVNVYS